MKFRPTSQQDLELCRKTGRLFAWLTAVVGLFLLWGTVTVPVHIVTVLLLILLPLCAGRERKALRVTARVLCGVVWAVAALLLALTVSTAVAGWSAAFPELAVMLCVMGGTLLCAFAPGAFALAIHGNRYDRVVACVCQTLLAVIGAVGAFTVAQERVIWLWDHPYVRYGFFGITVAGAILTWLCALVKPTPSPAATGEKDEADAVDSAADTDGAR